MLRAYRGRWSSTSRISFAYAWKRCHLRAGRCRRIAGATRPTYRVPDKDVGFRLRVRVTARNRFGARWLESAPTSRVAGAPVVPGVTDAPASRVVGAPPVVAGATDAQPRFPILAAFYYPWFPETWTVGGQPTHYTPSLGFYASTSASVIRSHIAAMQYANIEVGISSWWGAGDRTDVRLPALLSTTSEVGAPLRWSVYYEDESNGNPTAGQITADLTYIRDHYAAHPSFFRVNGRFVVFVYSAGGDACEMADRWQQANTVGAYVVLKVFTGFRTCAGQPDAWHQYGPATAVSNHPGHSYSISPGFYKADETSPRLARDLTRWKQNVRDMIASNAPLQLVTTFNEWGEGTAVESANEWASPSGYGEYLDALHNGGG
jgi:hypothetical protein